MQMRSDGNCGLCVIGGVLQPDTAIDKAIDKATEGAARWTRMRIPSGACMTGASRRGLVLYVERNACDDSAKADVLPAYMGLNECCIGLWSDDRIVVWRCGEAGPKRH
jgi:hypothetical protein